MNLLFAPNGWEDYLFWHENHKTKLKQIHKLLEDIKRHPFQGRGKPEPLTWEFEGCWSRRMDQEHRLVYRVEGENIHILMCRYHYLAP